MNFILDKLQELWLMFMLFTALEKALIVLCIGLLFTLL